MLHFSINSSSTEEMIDSIFKRDDHIDDGKEFKLRMIILSGSIGTGKSTLCNKLANIYNATIVNKDSILESLTGTYGKYDSEKVMIYDKSEEAITHISLKLGKSVIIDRLNYTKELRKRFIDIAKSYNAEVVCYDFGSGSEVTLQRRLDRNRGVPARIWRELFNTVKADYETPTEEEGIVKILTPPSDKEFKFYAFDIDGTLFSATDDLTTVGELRSDVVALMKRLYLNPKNIIIIWTCRTDDSLNEALSVLRTNNVYWDMVNENYLAPFKTSAKPFFHVLFDDRVINVNDISKFDEEDVK